MALNGHEILIGVTGGIAAYKAAILVSRLVQTGAGVSVIMTESATHLVALRTFEALSGRVVRTSMWEEGSIHPHIESSQQAELLCIAPATANFIGKAAHGIADDLLSTTYMAFTGNIILAPAMNCAMWEKPAVQRNIALLLQDGITLVGPESGHLSCGQTGVGRMSEPDVIFNKIVSYFI